jgi:DNA-binding response OmpR family regulator
MLPVVLLAEHEPEVAELARRYLARAGLTVTVATKAEDTIAALGEHSAAAAVLDLTMPGLDARRIRRLLRPRAPHRRPAAAAQPGTRRDTAPGVSPTVPVYLLGSGMRPRDVRVSADVCLYRPFSPRLLVARVLAAVTPASRATPFAQGAPSAQGTLFTHAAPLDPSAPEDHINPSAPGGPMLRTDTSPTPATSPSWSALTPAVPLTPAESALLSALVARAGRVLTRDQLRAVLSSPGRPSSVRAVDVHIAQLRAKLPAPGAIRTVRGVGYIVDGPRDGRPGSPRPGNMRDASR